MRRDAGRSSIFGEPFRPAILRTCTVLLITSLAPTTSINCGTRCGAGRPATIKGIIGDMEIFLLGLGSVVALVLGCVCWNMDNEANRDN
jgi:hypothetical protein